MYFHYEKVPLLHEINYVYDIDLEITLRAKPIK